MSRGKPKNTGGNTQGNSTRDVNAAMKAQLAMRYRAQRLSWDEVATKAGFSSRGAAHNAVQRELSRCVTADVKLLQQEESVSLDLLESECWELFLNKNNTFRLYAADRILAAKERRAKLMGLDTPVDTALTGNVVVVREVPNGYLAVEAKHE
jgi:hypothetical protein